MQFVNSVILLFSLLSSASSAPSNLKYVVHEKREFGLPHRQYQKLQKRSHEEATIPVRIAIAQKNLHMGYEYLMDVSHPDSKNFGKHWTAKQVHEMFSPSQNSVDVVKEWLVNSGIDESRIEHIGVTKWLHANVTVGEAESLLQTKYYAYNNLQTGEEHISCDHYSVPEHLQEHIDLITPTISMTTKHRASSGKLELRAGNSIVKRRTSRQADLAIKRESTPPAPRPAPFVKSSVVKSNDLSICRLQMDPQCMKALYNIPDGTKSTLGNELGIAEWQDSLDSTSLKMFLQNFTNIPSDAMPTIVNVDGGEHARAFDNDTSAPHTESNLDFQMVMPLIYPQSSIMFQVGDDVQDPDFDDLLLAFDADFANADGGDTQENNHYPTPKNFPPNEQTAPTLRSDPTYKGFQGKKAAGSVKRPNVLSSSYGFNERTQLSARAQNRQCNEYMKLGLMGTSVLYATGDSGVGSEIGCFPLSNSPADQTAAAKNLGGRFLPDFPANCPYVTAVGGTMLKPGQGLEGGEMAVMAPKIYNATINLYGGGGFSDVFPMPEYQKTAVTGYLKNYPPPYNASIFNSTGRGYPDISAISLNMTFINGRVLRTTGYGTSIAAPLVASIVTLINEERLAMNKSTVGFLNPTLYANPGAFNDVVEGSNVGCGTAGFNATPGWDASTGLGTPNYPKLLKVFMDLP